MKELESKVQCQEVEGLPFEIVIVEHKELLFKIVTMEQKWLRIILFLLVFLNLRKLILNCRTNSGKKNSNDMAADVA